MKILYSLLLASVVASGCGVRAAAKTTPDAPPLDMPAPPARDVEPDSAETPPPVPLAAEPARNAPPRAARPVPREQPPRLEPPRVEPPKPEPPAAEPPKVPEEPPKPPLSTLQTAPPTADAGMERGIRASLARANSDLNRIDYRVLNADARTQYDTAKRFIRQADDALKSKNLVFAKNLADKAAALAAQLGGR